jgi:hypothetical protein
MLKYNAAPQFKKINSDTTDHVRLWQDAMDWARLEFEQNALKAEFVKWSETHDSDHTVHYQTLPAWHYLTVGRIAYLIMQGAEAPQTTAVWFNKQIELLKKQKIAVVEESEFVTYSAKERKIFDYVDLYTFIDAVRVKYADDGETLEEKLMERFKRVTPNQQLLKKLYTHYKDTLAAAMADKQNEHAEKTIAPLILIVNTIAGASGNAKVASYNSGKATRKAVKAAEKVSVKVIDTDTNMASINPAQLPGSTLAVIYNSKDRKAMIYYATAGETLSIKGTKVINFDESRSFAKTLRKPKDVLPGVSNAATTRRIDVIFEDINGKVHPVNGRISKEMLIVKLFK